MTQRAISTLAGVDVVACEDTRRTGLLLSHHGVSNRLLSYHEYNKLRRTPELLEFLRQGKSVALVSDAGTPGISDPGFHLIRAAADAGYRVIPVPGASALLAALVVSGLPSDRFVFEGFLPKRDGRRRRRIAALAHESRTMVFCEAARRVGYVLAEMLEMWGDRRAVLCRELTKKFEEILRGRLSEIIEAVRDRSLKGETVLVVAGHGRDAED